MRTIRTENANKTGGKERTNKGRDQKIIVPSLLLTALFAILAAVIIMAPGDPGNDHDCIGSTPNGGDEEIIDLSITPSPANGICWSYSFDNGIGNYTISCHANVRVIQNEMKDRSAEITDRRITVEENTTDVVIILDNVYFSASAGSIGASAITLLGGSEVTLIIEGDNEIGGSGVGEDTYPGIETTGATLTIRNGEIPGELTVRGA
ncbi:MAG: hypothetical protein FWG58_01985, partial [Methanomassiliicoccaceae archaeon]|nr:hypothetical protein [Methanomassiliicoccaceae archaeon]